MENPNNLSKPHFEGFGLSTGNGLKQTQNLFGISHIPQTTFPVMSGHFQLVSMTKQYTSFFFEFIF